MARGVKTLMRGLLRPTPAGGPLPPPAGPPPGLPTPPPPIRSGGGVTLGEGGFGRVVAGTWNGRPVAIKTVQTVEEARREARNAAHFHHDNVLKIYAQLGRRLYMERLGRTFFDLRVRSPATSLRLIKDVLRGLVLVHDHGFVHGDVTPPNLMADPTVRRGVVVDLGSLILAGGLRSALTPRWAAPEASHGRPATFAQDVYGLGQSLLLFCDPLQPPPLSRLDCFIGAMLQPEPHRRPTALEALVEVEAMIATGIHCPTCGRWTLPDLPYCA